MSGQATNRVVSRAATWLTAAGFILLIAPAAQAAGPAETGRFWAAFDLGKARLPAAAPSLSQDETHFFFDVSLGLAVSPHVLLGAEVGAWIIESNWGQNRGAGIDTVFVTARVYPLKKSPLHVRLGGGLILGWDKTPPGSNVERLGWEVGVGYDVKLFGRHHLTPFVTYCNAHVGRSGANLDVLTFGAGWTYR
jgi:hypothetical protein